MLEEDSGIGFLLSYCGAGSSPGWWASCIVVTMKEYAKGFYKSKAWQRTRAAYLKSVGGLCEPCLERGLYSPAEIVHHKTHITPKNITDPEITLNWDNLQAVCRSCHERIHTGKEKRFEVDELGRVTIPPYA